jgi:hypothetical protein
MSLCRSAAVGALYPSASSTPRTTQSRRLAPILTPPDSVSGDTDLQKDLARIAELERNESTMANDRDNVSSSDLNRIAAAEAQKAAWQFEESDQLQRALDESRAEAEHQQKVETAERWTVQLREEAEIGRAQAASRDEERRRRQQESDDLQRVQEISRAEAEDQRRLQVEEVNRQRREEDNEFQLAMDISRVEAQQAQWEQEEEAVRLAQVAIREEAEKRQIEEDELLMAQAQSKFEMNRRRTMSAEKIARAMAQNKLATGTTEPKVIRWEPAVETVAPGSYAELEDSKSTDITKDDMVRHYVLNKNELPEDELEQRKVATPVTHKSVKGYFGSMLKGKPGAYLSPRTSVRNQVTSPKISTPIAESRNSPEAVIPDVSAKEPREYRTPLDWNADEVREALQAKSIIIPAKTAAVDVPVLAPVPRRIDDGPEWLTNPTPYDPSLDKRHRTASRSNSVTCTAPSSVPPSGRSTLYIPVRSSAVSRNSLAPDPVASVHLVEPSDEQTAATDRTAAVPQPDVSDTQVTSTIVEKESTINHFHGPTTINNHVHNHYFQVVAPEKKGPLLKQVLTKRLSRALSKSDVSSVPRSIANATGGLRRGMLSLIRAGEGEAVRSNRNPNLIPEDADEDEPEHPGSANSIRPSLIEGIAERLAAQEMDDVGMHGSPMTIRGPRLQLVNPGTPTPSDTPFRRSVPLGEPPLASIDSSVWGNTQTASWNLPENSQGSDFVDSGLGVESSLGWDSRSIIPTPASLDSNKRFSHPVLEDPFRTPPSAAVRRRPVSMAGLIPAQNPEDSSQHYPVPFSQPKRALTDSPSSVHVEAPSPETINKALGRRWQHPPVRMDWAMVPPATGSIDDFHSRVQQGLGRGLDGFRTAVPSYPAREGDEAPRKVDLSGSPMTKAKKQEKENQKRLRSRM